MSGKISAMTAAVVGDLAATTSDLEVSINVTTVPLTRRSTLGTLATWLATVGFLASTITATAFAGPLTGNVTGNVSGSAATVTGAAQAAITSVGQLTALSITGSITSGAAGAAINAVVGTPVTGVDVAAGSLRLVANLSTGAGTPAGLTFQGGQVLGTGVTVQTAANMWTMRQGTTTAITEFVAGQATARIVGGSTNGLAIRDSGNTRDNLRVFDNGTRLAMNDGTQVVELNTWPTSGERLIGGGVVSSQGTDNVGIVPVTTSGMKAFACYFNQTQYLSAWEVANTAAGFGTLSLMKSGGDVQHGAGATYATTDVLGFLFLPTVAGAQTGVPTNATDKQSAIRFDTTNNKLWVYNHVSGAWKSIVLI